MGSWGSWKRETQLPGRESAQADSCLRCVCAQTFRGLSGAPVFSPAPGCLWTSAPSSSGKKNPCAAALSPSSGIFLRIPTSWLRSLWGFPFNQPERPSFVLCAPVTLTQAKNPRPIINRESVSLLPFLRRHTGFTQGGIPAPTSRPL